MILNNEEKVIYLLTNFVKTQKVIKLFSLYQDFVSVQSTISHLKNLFLIDLVPKLCQ